MNNRITRNESTLSRDRPAPAGPKPSRREFFHRIADGLHGAALASLLSADLYAASTEHAAGASGEPRIYDLSPKTPHFEPKPAFSI